VAGTDQVDIDPECFANREFDRASIARCGSRSRILRNTPSKMPIDLDLRDSVTN